MYRRTKKPIRLAPMVGVLFIVGLLLVLASGAALAVHNDGLFQLDYTTSPAQGAANVSSTNISPPGNTGDDWDIVYAGTSNAFATAFIADGVGTAEKSFFTGGGSKDTNDIPQWLYDTVNDVVPDKDDIEHAFAAAYDRPSDGHTIVYFGADRFDAGDGSAELGFWFFRGPVTLNPLAPGATTGTFSGAHRVGDLLVLVEFVRGGNVGEVNVYEWDGAGGDNLNKLLTANAASCATAAANDIACAVINQIVATPAEPPWPYINKDGATTYAQFALFEGGIDFTAILGQDIGCFSSFMAETRSSGSSVQAQLKDFALGAFPICGVKVTKTGDTLSKIGDPVDYTVTIENTGRATLYKYNISDTLLGAITTAGVDQTNAYVLTNTCGASLAPGASCTITLRRTVLAGDPDPLKNTVSILYKEFANFTGIEFTSSDDHSVNLFQPAVEIEKTGDELSKVTDPAHYTFTITNKSSQDSPNLTLASISDNVIGDLMTQATAAGCDVLTYNEVCSFSLDRTVLGGDPDPLVNTVDALYHPVGFPNDITASDGHSVNLFQPSVSIEKTGNTLSKIGDSVTYHVKIINTSSSDSPNLVLDSISDDVLGDLSDEAPAACDSIAPGASCEFDVPWTVAAVDIHPADGKADDPVINTVTIHFHPAGFDNDITATASHELNLFQPSIAFSKTADTELSKATDVVNYTLTLNNTSSTDTPDMSCTITDAKLGVDKTVTLKSGEGDVTNVAYTVQAGDPDPLVNTASVKCTFADFPNVLEASSGLSINLFQPGVMVEKSGDTLSKIGDGVTYHFKITNTSSNDSPNLALDSISDNLLGSLTAPAECDNMAPGGYCDFDVPWTVAAGSPDPVANIVEVHYHPAGFLNDISDTDDHSLNLFQPSITFSKTAGTKLSKATDVVNYTLTLNNTSSPDTPDMVCTITDAKLGVNKQVTLASGACDVTNVAYTVQATDPDPLKNEASVSCSPTGFPNVLEGSGSWEVNLFQPAVEIEKTGNELSKIGDSVTYNFKITNKSSQDSPNLELASISDNMIGDLKDEATAAGCDVLTFEEVCSFDVTRTVLDTDPDPVVNTVDVLYHPAGFPNDITASDGHSVNLFNPDVSIEKSGPALSKIGDEVTYHFKITNTGSPDSPNLVLDSISDDVLGDLASYAGDCASLPPDDPATTDVIEGTCEFDVPWTVAAVDLYGGDPQGPDSLADDPVINTVTIHFHPDGFTNDITATASHELNLFQPSIAFAKTADTKLSKVGDVVNYTITLNNTSSDDTPDLLCTITDALLGLDKYEVTLASGDTWTQDYAYTVKDTDPDPLVNTASVSCSPTGFPNVLTGEGSWTVNLFQPSVLLTKTGPAYSKAGDTATFNVTIENTSSDDAPDLVLDSFSDSLVAGVTPPADCNTLSAVDIPETEDNEKTCSFSYTYVVQTGDSDPLENTATAHYKPFGFPNDITDSSSWTTDLVQPSFTVTKVCKAEPISQAGPAVFTITFNNTGTADLDVVPSEGAAFSVAAGGSYSYEYSIPGPFSATVQNTVTGDVTLDSMYGLSNSYTFSASDSCDVKGLAKVVKTVSGQLPAAGQTFTFQLRSGASTTSEGTILEQQNTDASGNLSFATELVPGQTYQICEWVFPGWNTNLAGDGPLFVPNSIIPPALPNPNVNNLTVCADFSVTSGQTRTFTVDNTPPPGGRALTIGFWKNWASCTQSAQKKYNWTDWALALASQNTTNPPGGLVVSAQNANGGWPNYASPWYLILKGDPTSTKDNVKNAPDCQKAVRLLDKSTITSNKKMASDPLFNMAAQLVGAELNRFTGAGISGVTITNIDRAVLLLGKYVFNGDTYTPKLSKADTNLANCLATQLDNYNNGRTASACP